jgi:hypothetical protein
LDDYINEYDAGLSKSDVARAGAGISR